MPNTEFEVFEGIEHEYVDDALRLAYDAFAKKFRTGFRNADDLTRLFHDSVDPMSCFSAMVDGRLAGILTFKTSDQEFYKLSVLAPFKKFLPVRAVRMFFNLALLAEEAGPLEFIVDSLAVDESCRGMGIGTALMHRAEEKARELGKNSMSLGVIGENEGAYRLYERLGFTTTGTWRGIMVRLAAGSTEVHRMEKPL